MSDSRALRVALVTEHYYPHPGGVSEHVFHLARYLADRGHTVEILTGRPERDVEAPAPVGVEVVHVGERHVGLGANGAISLVTVGTSLGRQLRELLARRRYDVLHLHAPLWPMLPLLALKHAPPETAVVGTIHSVFPPTPWLRLLRPYLQRCLDALGAIISVSESVPMAHASVGLRYEGEVIPNGIDLAYWRTGRALPELADRVNLLTLARLDPRNQLDLVIRALPIVKRACPEARLVMVGDGPERARLEAAIPVGLRGDVIFAGSRLVDRNDFTASAQVFCFTHGLASQSVALSEGMAAGLPVVYQNAEFTRRAITHGEEGFGVPAGSVEAYAEAIIRLVRDASLRERMGRAAQARVAELGWPLIGPRIERVYQALLERPPC